MRILFFACDPSDVQRTLKHDNRTEVALLPSYEMEEIQNEIARFAPRLITCRADFLLSILSGYPSPTALNGVGQPALWLPTKLPPSPIPPRETNILSMLVQGKTNNEIALALNLSTRTVKRTLSGLFERFGVINRTELSNRTARLRLPINDK
jgi:DNA-binding NarL/FixJ family response regulator